MSLTAALTAGSIGLQIFGQIRKGQQEQQIFNFNAAVSRQKAELTRLSGDLRISQLRDRKRRLASSQVAGFAGAGVRITGTPLQVIADSDSQAEIDIMLVDIETRNAILAATSDAELDILRGSLARSSSLISAGTTLLSQIPSFVSSRNLATVNTTSGGGGTPFAPSAGDDTRIFSV